MKKLLLLLLIIPVFAGCRVTGVGVHATVGTPPPPHYDHFQYYYYPDAEVYFDISRNVYFYYYGGRWVMSARLPRHIHIEIDDHVILKLETDRPYSYHPKHLQAYPRGKWKKHYRNGPPDHAPAHGYRSQYRNYQYYPDANVYYDAKRNVYFYPSGKRWVETHRLPKSYRFNRDDYVEIEDESERPYERHQNHRSQYPKNNWKQMYRQQQQERRKELNQQQYENDSRSQERKSRQRPDDRDTSNIKQGKRHPDDSENQEDQQDKSPPDENSRRGRWKSNNY